MFAVGLNLERDPLRLGDVPAGMLSWVQDVGGFAAAGLLLWLLFRALVPGQRSGAGYLPWGGGGDEGQSQPPRWASALFSFCVFASALAYVAVGVVLLPELLQRLSANLGGEKAQVEPPTEWRTHFLQWGLTAAAACALVAVCVPFVLGVVRLRWRRIWALARLSIKDAVRGRVLYVFSALVLVVLFSGWFVRSKPEAQINTYVKIAFAALTPLLLMSAGLIAAFSIPNDIRRQTIHTIVTKPVERFEIVLGRFLGYLVLMTGVLVVLTTLSLFFVLRGANADANAESLKARVPLYGELDFQKSEGEYSETRGERTERVNAGKDNNVGREWDYHKYIPGSDPRKVDAARQYAVWSFYDLPRSLTRRDKVRCEYKFDIYRTTKGKENAGVQCSFFFQTRYYKKTYANHEAYVKRRGELGAGAGFTPEADNKASREFGYYEVEGVTIADYHTLHVDVPAGLIENALDGPPGGGTAEPGMPLLLVRVRCDTPTQFVGMARYDLYFRADDIEGRPNAWAFAVNFYKASGGLWMRLCLVIGLCTSLSTELGGIISFLVTMLLYLGGMAHEFIRTLAAGGTPGGGAAESAYRLLKRKNLIAPLDETTGIKVITAADEVFRWVIRRVLNIFPDVDRFSFTEQVANGFDIGVFGQDLLPTLLLLLGYLLPWVVLGFYLMKSREIAGNY